MVDPFNQPDNNEIVRIMANGKVELIADSTITINKYLLRYLRKPVEMNINTSTTCELSEHTHNEVLNIAIDIALENIEAKRNQTFPKILQTEE